MSQLKEWLLLKLQFAQLVYPADCDECFKYFNALTHSRAHVTCRKCDRWDGRHFTTREERDAWMRKHVCPKVRGC